MRCRNLTGSVFALAIFASGTTGAAACDPDDCYGCGGYGYYTSSANYGYYARPLYTYAPAVYYAPPAYAYYVPAPAYYAPPTLGYSYARPYYGWRGGYVDATGNSRRDSPIPATIPMARGMYASGTNTGHKTTKAPSPNQGARSIAATAGDRIRPANKVSVAADYVAHGKYIPSVYHGRLGGYVGPRP